MVLRGSFAGREADRLHDLLASTDPARAILVDFRSVRYVDPIALAVLAGEFPVHGRRLTFVGLSQRNQRLLSDFARQLPN